MRERDETKQRLIDALGALLAEQGFAGLGINAIAAKAQLDKVLIYRYFGGLGELLAAFAKQSAFWPTTRELLGRTRAKTQGLDLAYALLAGHVRELRKRPMTQEIMRWELFANNELTDELARVREAQGLEILALLGSATHENEETLDLAAIGALLHAGLSYLVLRGKTAPVYMGVPLGTAQGDARLLKAIRQLIDMIDKSQAAK